jgi:hypothetical protein
MRGVDEIARPDHSQPGVGGRAAVSQVRELMDDCIGTSMPDSCSDGPEVERVGECWLSAE